MFDTELRFFIENQDALVALYRGKFIVLRGEEVVGAYDTPLEADIQARKRFAVGTYMLQRCVPGPDAYTVRLAGALFA